MFTIKEVMVEEARAKEKMRQAEYNRLAAQLQQNSWLSQFGRSALSRLGSILMAAGRKLQARGPAAAARQSQEQMGVNREIWIHTH